MHEHKYTVLVTGFGPFGGHPVNASWEAVKQLEHLCVNSKEFENIRLIVKEIPVSYDYVSTHIPQLWKEYNPTIVLHVGVSHKVDCLAIECHAHSNGYVRPDIDNKNPDESNVVPNILKTDVNVDQVCAVINENSPETGCKASVSRDASRYLCEYIYYHSLSIEPGKTLFIHVPDFGKYSSLQTAKGLLVILRYMLNNLNDVV